MVLLILLDNIHALKVNPWTRLRCSSVTSLEARMWYVCFITHLIFCPFGGLWGVSGTSITGTTLPFTPRHWLLDVRDHCGVLAPPLVSERARGIWQQRCLSWLCDVSLVNAKAEKEGTTSFRRKIFLLEEPNHRSKVHNRGVTSHIISRKQDY